MPQLFKQPTKIWLSENQYLVFSFKHNSKELYRILVDVTVLVVRPVTKWFVYKNNVCFASYSISRDSWFDCSLEIHSRDWCQATINKISSKLSKLNVNLWEYARFLQDFQDILQLVGKWQNADAPLKISTDESKEHPPVITRYSRWRASAGLTELYFWRD